MIQPVVVAALIAVAGGVVAITARDGRLVALGLMVAMVAAVFVASPQPAVLAVLFRVLGSLLAAYVLIAAARDQSIESEGSGIGVLAEMAAAAGAFSIGWFIVPVQPITGPLAAQAAGAALVAIAIVPLTGRDVLRVGVAAAVLVIGGSLLLQAWAGSQSSVGQIFLTALIVAVAGATSLLISPAAAPATQPATAAAQPASPALAGEIREAAGLDVARAEAVPESTGEAVPEPAAAAVIAPAGPGARGRRGSGTIPKKAARAAEQPSDASPMDASPAPVRFSTIRTAPYRPLRGESWSDPSRPPGNLTPAEETEEFEPEMPPPFAPPGRVRRLRPREPRR
jgi:hypothetical protein